VHETFEAESDAIVVAVEVVSVAVAAVKVEREAVAVLGVEVPSRRHVTAGRVVIARRPGRHRLVTVAGPVAPPPVAAPPTAVRRAHCSSARCIAIVLSSEVVSVASTAAVHQRSTLGHIYVPVESQVLVETRAGFLGQQAGVCQHGTTHELAPEQRLCRHSDSVRNDDYCNSPVT